MFPSTDLYATMVSTKIVSSDSKPRCLNFFFKSPISVNALISGRGKDENYEKRETDQ